MKRKVLFFTICIFFLLTTTAFASPSIISPSAILINGKTGQILYEKNIDKQLYPASITKVMTALLLLEEGELDQVVEINDDVPLLIEAGSSQIYLIPGETLTREQLLYALLVDSANDAAVAIAQDISGSVENFAKKMNDKAQELGAKNTHFVNPNGLHDENHYTTARDMAIIAREAMKNPTFREVVSTERYIIPATNKQDTRYLYVTNRLIRNTTYRNYQYEGATGIKTGWTSDAKNTLIGGATKENLDLITVVMNADGTSVYEDTHRLLDFGFDNFYSKTAIKEGEVAKEINLTKPKDSLPLIAKESFEYSILKDNSQDIMSSIKVPEDISLPIEKGDEIGSIVYSLNGVVLDSIPLLAAKSIESPNFLVSFFSSGLNILKGIGIALIVFLLYRTWVYVHKKRKRARRRRMFQSKIKYRSINK